MKVSEIVKELNEVLEEDGDIDVIICYNNQFFLVEKEQFVVLPSFIDENWERIPIRLGIGFIHDK